MAAVAFPAVGLAYDHINGFISIPLAHAFNTYFSAMGIPNAANGVRDYPIHLLQMLHFSLSRRNPNNVAELDNIFYGAMGIDELSIFQSIQVAVTAGFTHGVVATGNHVLDGYQIVRAAQVWAQAHTSQLNPVLAAGFYNLPGMPGAGTPPRIKMSYSMLEEPNTGYLRPVAKIIGLGGYVHSAASRANGSRLSVVFDTIVDRLGTPPIATQPPAVARAIVYSGLPPPLAAYPVSMGEQYPHLLLRLHYLAGTPAEQRAAFSSYSSLLLAQFPVLRDFLQPAANEEQLVAA